MKRKLVFWVLSLSLLTSCAVPAAQTPDPLPSAPAETEAAASAVPAETSAPKPITADMVAQAVVDSQPSPESYEARLSEVTGENPDGGLGFYLELYGVDRDLVNEAAIYTVGGVDAREIAVFGLYRGGLNYDTASTAEDLEEYRQNRRGDFYGYVPEQADIVERGRVLEREGWVALLMCEDMPAAEEAFEALAAIPAEWDHPTPEPEAAPTPPPEESSEPYVYDWTDYVDERGWRLFDPPNEFDMTPYDTSAILAAWEAGEESGLTEKDAAILEKCKEALELAVEPGMTDFQKELNLHDWLVQSYYGCYDRTVHDPKTPMGREDNLNPYGLLVRGYGICLSYATTFQLLMDLAEVECITVIGASSSSSGDHAWNMVKLEGEWYCVDPTWNATYREGLTQETMWPWQHRYFNVTSEDMRQTDHQWDYDSIPEATATRFRWDGTGAPPQ